MECYCDDGGVITSVYKAILVTAARKEHKCYECARAIMPGERYERVFAVWDGGPSTCKTCARCLDLRDFVKAHVPCFCWFHGNMIEDAVGTAGHYSHEAPGLLFGAYRRKALIYRAPRKGSDHARH